MKITLKKLALKSRFLGALAGLFLLNAPLSFAQVDGKAIFQNNCAACHAIETDVVGPALKDVHKRRDEAWIKDFVKNSQKMVQAGDKEAVALFEKFNKLPMPAFESSLDDEKLTALIGYIKTESEAPVAATTEVTTPEDPKKSETPVAAPFDFRKMPLVNMLLLSLGLFLLVVFMVMGLMVFVQALPLLGKLYEKPALKHTFMARMVAMLRGDTSTIVGKHRDVLIEDHDYDNIHEFDNDLPPWWRYLFYATIIFSVAYMLHYHVFKTGKLQDDEYQMEIQHAALLAPKGGAEGNVNEVTNFKPLTEAAALEAGKTAYIQNCAACHGQNGEGVVGPNLVDEYWLHGGDINDVFKVVKYGVTSKGMVAWQKKLSDDQILEVSSYLLSLQGTNPANAKAPQGEKYEAKK